MKQFKLVIYYYKMEDWGNINIFPVDSKNTSIMLNTNGVGEQNHHNNKWFQYYATKDTFGIKPMINSSLTIFPHIILIKFNLCGKTYSNSWNTKESNNYYIINNLNFSNDIIIPTLELIEYDVTKKLYHIIADGTIICRIYTNKTAEIEKSLNNYNNYYQTSYNIGDVTIVLENQKIRELNIKLKILI